MGEWVEQFALGQGGHLRVEQRAGAVRIKGVPGEIATVKATWPGSAEMAERLRLEHRPGVLEVEVQAESHGWFGFQADRNPVDLLIEVPVGTVCTIDTGSGATEVVGTNAGVRLDAGSGPILLRQVGNVHLDGGSGQVLIDKAVGELTLEIGSGPLVVRNVTGALTIDAGSGNQLLESIEGSVRIEVGSGRVEVRGCKGPELKIDAGSGELKLHDLAVQSLSVETGSGRLLVDLAQVAPSGQYQIDTGSSGVTVQLPVGADLDLDLNYEGGRLELGGLPVRVNDQERGELHGRMGRGGARLEIETGGSIRLQPRPGESARVEREPQVVVAAEAVGWEDPETAFAEREAEWAEREAEREAERAEREAERAEREAEREGERAMREAERAMREGERAMREGERAMREGELAMREGGRSLRALDWSSPEVTEAGRGTEQTLEEILELVAQGKLSPSEADLLISRLGE